VLTSPTEWSYGGRYRIDYRSGAMHSEPPLIRELKYGSDGQSIFLAVELNEEPVGNASFEFRLRIRTEAGQRFQIRACAQQAGPAVIETDLAADAVSAAIDQFCEMRISLNALGLRSGAPFFLQLVLYREGLPVAFLPAHGELRLLPTPMTAFAF
jgi:hypothetical protein